MHSLRPVRDDHESFLRTLFFTVSRGSFAHASPCEYASTHFTYTYYAADFHLRDFSWDIVSIGCPEWVASTTALPDSGSLTPIFKLFLQHDGLDRAPAANMTHTIDASIGSADSFWDFAVAYYPHRDFPSRDFDVVKLMVSFDGNQNIIALEGHVKASAADGYEIRSDSRDDAVAYEVKDVFPRYNVAYDNYRPIASEFSYSSRPGYWTLDSVSYVCVIGDEVPCVLPPVPLPSTGVILLAGIGCLGGVAFRRRRSHQSN